MNRLGRPGVQIRCPTATLLFMFLVHVRVRSSGGAIPADAAVIVAECAEPADRVEHVVLHRVGVDEAVLGVFLLAPSLASAEATVTRVCRTAAARRGELCDWLVGVGEVPLIVGRQVDGLLMPRPDQDSKDPYRFP